MTTLGSITVKGIIKLWGTKPQNTCSLIHDQERVSQQIFYLKITDFLSRQWGTVHPIIFSGNHDNGKRGSEKLQAELYQQIGQLKVELDWLKKKVGYLG